MSVTLANDLSNCAGDGLEVTGSNLTVNLNGHTVDGSGSGEGVRVAGKSVTVLNGTITDFDVGLELDGIGGRAQGIHASGSVIGIFDQSANDLITGNFVSQNGQIGIADNGPHAVIANNWARGSGLYGVEVVGVGSTVTGNRALSNTATGIGTGSSEGIVVAGNIANGNGTNGISTGGRTTLKNNTTSFNTGLGISATAFDTDGGGNHAAGNGSQHQCSNVVC